MILGGGGWAGDRFLTQSLASFERMALSKNEAVFDSAPGTNDAKGKEILIVPPGPVKLSPQEYATEVVEPSRPDSIVLSTPTFLFDEPTGTMLPHGRQDAPRALQRKKRPTYFVNHEVRSDNIAIFPRWTGMLSRFNKEARSLDTVCGAQTHTPCKLKAWQSFLDGLRKEPLLERLKGVNRYINTYPYVDDILNWGFDNYWETPYEFQRRSGNCKDYAIAKYMSLRALGVPADAMRVVVLKDLNLGGIIHAILVVSAGGKSYILDNQIKQVVSTDRVYHYVPIYSINENHWWQHFVLE